MKFSGPTTNSSDWQSESTITIEFVNLDELEKNDGKYLKAKRCIARTSSAAKPGDKKQLVFKLPNGDSIETEGIIEKVKEQPDKGYAISLFKLENFGDAENVKIAKALAPKDDDLDLDDDDMGFELTNDFAPPADNASTSGSSSSTSYAKVSAPIDRSNLTEEDLVRSILRDDEPDDYNIEDAELPEELKGVSGDLLMPKKDGEGDEPDPDLEQKKFITAFVLTFTKSVQKSGYYGDANHPEAKKAKKGLYSLFRRIIGRHRELNFIRQSVGSEPDVMVDGALDEMISLREIMPHGMAELYIPRFLEYLQRRCLISLSIKRVIDEETFDRFIDLMSQYSPEFKDDARKEGERFTRTLIEHGIVEISAIFDEDIISSGRKLPWQAELTLSRLKKDLKTVPLLKNATEDELRQIKIRIFSDTIKPLRNPVFLIAVLLNADLIMEGIEDMAVLKDLDVEEFMINGAEIEFLARTSLDIIKELLGVRELKTRAPLEAQRQAAEKQEKVLVRILKHITNRLLREKNDVVYDTLEEFFLKKLIPFKSLPISIQERITNKKLMEAFQHNSEEIMDRFGSHLSDKEFSEFINRFQRVVPLLAEKKEFLLIGRIMENSAKFLDDRDARRKSLTKRFFDYIATTDVLKQLKEAFDTDDKELRGLIAGVFVSFGKMAVPMLLDILKTNEDKWVRKLIIRSIIDIGKPAVQPMVNELYKEDNPWFFTRNIVNMLGELGDKKIIGKLNLLLYHPNASVREETVNSLYKVAPQQSELHLVKALDDADMKVKSRAIGCLGMMGSQNDKVMRFYKDVLEGKTELENEALQIQVYRAVGLLGDLEESRRQVIQSILMKKLETAYGIGLMAMFRKAKGSETISDGVKMAICTALGQIGKGKAVEKILVKIANEKDPILSQKGKEAKAMFDSRKAATA